MDNTRAADLSFVIKICGITCVEDAQTAVDAGANALGFNFYGKSPRFITPELAREIAAQVSGTYWRVGVFVNATAREMMRTAEMCRLDVLQLHGACELPPHRLWRSVPGDFAAGQEDGRIEAYLLDAVTAEYGGSGKTFDWQRAIHFPHRTIVAGGLEASNVAAAIAALRPWGVDACSRLESAPGKKDARRVREFVKAAHSALLGEVL